MTAPRGFALLPPQARRALASKGGRSRSPLRFKLPAGEAARAAGRLGGLASAETRRAAAMTDEPVRVRVTGGAWAGRAGVLVRRNGSAVTVRLGGPGAAVVNPRAKFVEVVA